MIVKGYKPATGEDAEYFVDGERRPLHTCAWEIPLAGVAYALADISQYDDQGIPFGAEDKKIIENVSSRFEQIYKRVAEDMQYLLEMGPVGDYRRNIALAPLHTLVRNFDKAK